MLIRGTAFSCMLRPWNRSISRLKRFRFCVRMCQHAVPSCEGNIKYVKCHVVGCDGSGKLIGEHFFIGVCLHLYNARRAICLLHAPIDYCVKTKQASGVVEIIDVAVF